MKNVESYILQIEDDKAGTEKKDLDRQVISEKILEEREVTVPTEYFAINLMNLI